MNGLNESCTAISSRENIQLLQSYIVTYRKKLKVLFVEEEFLYKKISKKDVYVDYASTADMAEDAVKQYRDLTALLHFCTPPPPPFFIDDSAAEFHAD